MLGFQAESARQVRGRLGLRKTLKCKRWFLFIIAPSISLGLSIYVLGRAIAAAISQQVQWRMKGSMMILCGKSMGIRSMN